MEIFVSPLSKVFILTTTGIRKPDIDEVIFAESSDKGNIIFLEGAITDQKLIRCKCNDDEIILEKTKDDELIISTAFKAPKALYKQIVELATQGDFILKLNKCENLNDLYYLDKIVESFKKVS